MRNTCYPQYTETLSEASVPVAGPYPVVYLDKVKQQLYWPAATSKDLGGKSWKVNLVEKTDD